MATWVSHLIVADKVLEKIPHLCPCEFCIGNIAPDCNIENEDFTSFTPSREVTHWMSGKYKTLSDAERFLSEYVKTKKSLSLAETSFLLGYYVHLITDAEFRNLTHNPQRLAKMWHRIKTCDELCEKNVGMFDGWDDVKSLFPKGERMKDIYSIEKNYLEQHKECGYLKYILPVKYGMAYELPDYIDYLPKGAISRKIKIMGYIPRAEKSKFPYVVITEEEYNGFLESAAAKAAEGIERYYKSIENG